jgi:uncharacterized protein (TIGR03118 family)
MRTRRLVPIGLAALAVLAAGARPAAAQFYAQQNLVSDGSVPAQHTDADLVNAWGLVAGPATPWWVSDNGTSLSTLYNGNTGAKSTLIVQVPGNPTGIVFNGDTTAFMVTNGTTVAAARFLFATEAGQILGWNNPPAPTPPNTLARVVVDNERAGAVYKGLAIATIAGKGSFLYATNFHDASVEMYDSSFNRVNADAFLDSALPAGYAPFGIQRIGGLIYVTYALQDADAHDDVPGMGHGFIDAFDTSGTFVRRVASGGILNSPWGLALAPDDFGKFSNALLVGNFGDGHIHAFDPEHVLGNGEYAKVGPLHSTAGALLTIDGLWALQFGNGGAAGPRNVLFFTAGPNDESDGLFGSLTPVAPQDK